jgi:hypothetical protein
MDTTTNTPKAKKSNPKKSGGAAPVSETVSAEVETSEAVPAAAAAPALDVSGPKEEAEVVTVTEIVPAEAVVPEPKEAVAASATGVSKAEVGKSARAQRYNGRISSYDEAWERAEAMGYSREDLVTRSGAIQITGVKSSGAFNTALWYAHKGDPVTDEEGNWVYDGKVEIRKQREGFHPQPVVGTLYGSYSLWLKGDLVRFREATKRPTQRAAVRAAAVRATGRTRKSADRPTAKAAARNKAKRTSTAKARKGK